MLKTFSLLSIVVALLATATAQKTVISRSQLTPLASRQSGECNEEAYKSCTLELFDQKNCEQMSDFVQIAICQCEFWVQNYVSCYSEHCSGGFSDIYNMLAGTIEETCGLSIEEIISGDSNDNGSGSVDNEDGDGDDNFTTTTYTSADNIPTTVTASSAETTRGGSSNNYDSTSDNSDFSPTETTASSGANGSAEIDTSTDENTEDNSNTSYATRANELGITIGTAMVVTALTMAIQLF